MDTEQLMCPHLLSNETLKQILQERCIEVPENIQSLDRHKLINIYNRIALPLSQRTYNTERVLGRRLNSLRLSRGLTTTIRDKNEHSSENNRNIKIINNNIESRLVKRTTNSTDSSQPLNNKIRSSNFTQKTLDAKEQSNEQKRKCNVTLKTVSKKRQKITWP